MIKKDLKCPKCGKSLLRMYSTSIVAVTCKCGCIVNLRRDKKQQEDAV